MNKEKLKEKTSNATSALFSGMATDEDIQEKARKSAKKMFSVRMDEDQVNQWKAYIEATGQTAEAVTLLAISEYMEKHKLKEYQRELYDLKLKLLNRKSL